MNEDMMNDVNLVMQKVYNDTGGTEDTAPEEEIIHVHHFPDADVMRLPDGTVIFKKNESTQTNIPIVESTPPDSPKTQPSLLPAYLMVSMYLFLIFSCLIFQFSVLFNPLTANITLVAKSQQVSLQGTLQLGRVLNSITVSQSATANTTGHAHQDAKAATGIVTFYNGQLQSVFVPAGTTLTGNSGVQIVTDADTNIPAANPPTWGITTVSAHAVNTGSSGNIAAYDINQGCCATAIKVVNTTSFSGGQDERDYRTVTKSDIANAAAPLKGTVTQGSTAALQGQLKTSEAVTTPSCTTTTISDHNPGEEATQVKVTLSETCSAVAYNQDTLQAKVTQLLTAQAAKKLGSGYSLLGEPQITVTQATTNHITPTVFLTFHAQSTWIYALSDQEQRHIKVIIAEKNTQKAKQLLSGLPGIESVSMKVSGFGDDSSIPKDISNIHLLIIYSTA